MFLPRVLSVFLRLIRATRCFLYAFWMHFLLSPFMTSFPWSSPPVDSQSTSELHGFLWVLPLIQFHDSVEGLNTGFPVCNSYLLPALICSLISTGGSFTPG